MKSLFLFGVLLSTSTVFFACSQKSNQETAQAPNPNEYRFYGDSVNLDKTVPVDSLAAWVKANGNAKVVIRGEVFSSCQKMGCWMKVAGKSSTEPIQVMMKDHKFFLPIADFKGKELIFSGVGFYDTTSVEDLREFAEDENLPADQIAKITEPKFELSFIAEGVAIPKEKSEKPQ